LKSVEPVLAVWQA